MSFTELLTESIEDKIKDIQVGMIGKVESFDGSKMRADVKPLLKIFDNENEIEVDYPILANLPVIFHRGSGLIIKPVYASGDLVWLGFSTYDIDNGLKEYTRLQSEKKFELHNAVVLGGITPDGFSGGAAFSDNAIVLGSESGSPEAMIKGESFLSGLDSFLGDLAGLSGGSPAQNAAAIAQIAVSAGTLKGQLDSFKSTDAKVT